MHLFRNYIKNSLTGCLLCIVVTCSFLVNLYAGFNISPNLLAQQQIAAIIVGVLTALLMLASYNKKTVIISLALGLVLCIALFVILSSRQGRTEIFEDKESNRYLYYMIMVATTLIIYILSRFRWGCALIFIGGSLILATLEFLYDEHHLIAFIVFMIASPVLYSCRSYERNALRADTQKPVFGKSFVVSLICVALIVGVGSGAGVLFLKAAHPPAREIKLITDRKALETIQRTGIADYNEIYDELMKTSRTEKKTVSSDQNKKQKNNEDQGGSDRNDTNREGKDRLDRSNSNGFKLISYLQKYFHWWYVPLFLFLTVFIIISVKMLQRRRRLRRMQGMEADEQMRFIYCFFTKSFRRLKITRKESDTLLDYAEKEKSTCALFESGKMSFGDMTQVYCRSVYGGIPVTEEELSGCRDLYDGFYRKCRAYLGRGRYWLKFIQL